MTREEALTVLEGLSDNPLFSNQHKAAFNIAMHDIKAHHDWDINNLMLINKDEYESHEPIINKDCVHCSKTYGTVGCCDTVNNEWVYSCKEGQREYLLDRMRAEIEQLRLHKAQFLTNDNKVCIDSQAVLDVIEKYKAENEDKE